MRNLLKISRPEFLPANSASLLVGVAWGLTLPVGLLWGLGIPLLLAYATITLVAAFAAQINTLADYELDSKDGTKRNLVEAMTKTDRRKLKTLMLAEIALSLIPLGFLMYLQQKPELILFWIAAVFLAHSYSAPPFRLKSRGAFAVISLLIVLSILPITFVTYIFTSDLTLPFALFLIGQALTVYGIIVPAEIRDYFTDKKMGIKTNTVKIGLVKSSLFGIALLTVGGTLATTGLGIYLMQTSLPWLSVFLVVMLAAYLHILRKYNKLYILSKQHVTVSGDKQQTIEENIVKISADNPKWITLVTQVIMLMCVILLVTKFF